jgi:DoxX-like family
MQKLFTPNWLHYFIAAIWIANGLFCKMLNLVPRHQEIVASILGNEHPRLLTLLIGVAEIGMAAWILSGLRRRLNVIVQILVIAIMNSLEFFLVPDLLLWGRVNALVAFAFIVLIYYNGFHLTKKITQHTACFHF